MVQDSTELNRLSDENLAYIHRENLIKLLSGEVSADKIFTKTERKRLWRFGILERNYKRRDALGRPYVVTEYGKQLLMKMKSEP